MTKTKRALWTSIKSSLKPNGFGTAKKRKKLRPRSKAMEKRMRIYRRKREAFLARNPFCTLYAPMLSEDVHHIFGRGKYLLDEDTWLAVSRKAHRKIHDNPAWAYEHGYLEMRV